MAAAAFNYRAKYELLTVGGLHGRGQTKNKKHETNNTTFHGVRAACAVPDGLHGWQFDYCRRRGCLHGRAGLRMRPHCKGQRICPDVLQRGFAPRKTFERVNNKEQNHGIMNDKEFNLQILATLTEYANEIIAAGSVTIKEDGEYTAYNIASGKNDMGERLHVDITGQNERKTLQVGGFSCTVTPYTVFGIIHKFEKICHVNNKNKTLFMFGDAQNNIFKERTMFIDGKGNVKTQNKTLRRQTEHTATNKYGSVYYQVTPSGVWYHVANDATPEMAEQFISIVFVRKGIERCKGSSFDPIYDALLAELEANEQAKEVEQTEKVEAIEVETKPIEQEKPKRTQGARFTFSMCGILPGEKIVFTPEQIEVTVADDTHVEFCGKLFTLSGFCRAFMPDGKRKPSNAYQGPKYFTYDGVTLVKLRSEKTACVEVETKEMQTEEKTAATPSDLAQERTEAHGLTTCRAEKNDGLKQIFAGGVNAHLPRGLATDLVYGAEGRNKYGNTAARMVVHTLPLPPPYHNLTITNNQQSNKKNHHGTLIEKRAAAILCGKRQPYRTRRTAIQENADRGEPLRHYKRRKIRPRGTGLRYVGTRRDRHGKNIQRNVRLLP